MNAKLLLTMLTALVLISPLSHAKKTDKKSERIHYKCHLRLDDNSEVVHRFVSVGETKAEFQKSLPGSTLYTENGEDALIETVYHCVTKKQRFGSKTKQAIELDKANTPF